MKPLNLYNLTRVNDPDIFSIYDQHLSARDTKMNARPHEINSIEVFVASLRSCSANYETLNNFFFSYEIPQIGKEFDLLRISDTEVINIELKSIHVDQDNIKKQLIKNKYYLGHLSRTITLFTFIKSDQTVYSLTEDNQLIRSTITAIVNALNSQLNCFKDNINSLFRVSNFLVSPLNTPERFISGQYFLTRVQEKIKGEILEVFRNSTSREFIGFTGGPGTGKTLLLYDIAKHMALNSMCCIIHCGILSDGHRYLDNELGALDIIDAKSVNRIFDFSKYKFIFVDESHRIYKTQYEIIIENANRYDIHAVFSYDSNQTLSDKERNRDIVSHIESLPQRHLYKLKGKVRTNKEPASFIRKFRNLNSSETITNYSSVSVTYANNT